MAVLWRWLFSTLVHLNAHRTVPFLAAPREAAPKAEDCDEPESLMPIARNRGADYRDIGPFATLQREIDRLFDNFARGRPILTRPKVSGLKDSSEHVVPFPEMVP